MLHHGGIPPLLEVNKSNILKLAHYVTLKKLKNLKINATGHHRIEKVGKTEEYTENRKRRLKKSTSQFAVLSVGIMSESKLIYSKRQLVVLYSYSVGVKAITMRSFQNSALMLYLNGLKW